MTIQLYLGHHLEGKSPPSGMGNGEEWAEEKGCSPGLRIIHSANHSFVLLSTCRSTKLPVQQELSISNKHIKENDALRACSKEIKPHVGFPG